MKVQLGSSGFVALLLFTLPLSQLAIDIYTPSMPHMVMALHASVATIQWSMTVYLLAMGIGMYFLGVWSDYIGRRSIYLYGFIIYNLGTLACLFAHSGNVLLLGRAIQGFGAGAIVCLTAMLSDVFRGEKLLKVSGYSSMVWSLMPIIAPFIGGLLQQYINWQANFVFMMIYGVIGYALLLIYLPETYPKDRRCPFKLSFVLTAMLKTISNRCFIGYVSLITLSWSIMVLFSIMTPFLFQSVYHIAPALYGLLALLFGLFYTIGVFLNSRLVMRLGVARLIQWGNIGMLSGGVLLAMTALLHWSNLWAVMLPCLYTVVLTGFIYPNAWAGAVETFGKETAGIASAMMAILVLGSVALITFLASGFNSQTQWPLAICFTVIGVLSMAIFKYLV